MPVYEYECGGCGLAFEQLVRSQRDERAVACPACGSRKIARRPSVFAAHRSGSRESFPAAACARCAQRDNRCPRA